MENGLTDLGAVELPIMPPFTASPINGTVPLSVQFNATNFDINGGAITPMELEFGDGTTGTGQTHPMFTARQAYSHPASS